MLKLNQVIAIEQTKKQALHREISELHHATQKEPLLTGHKRVFTPVEDGGECPPDNTKKVQILHEEVIEQVSERMSELLDLTATKDWANCKATADVLLDGEPFLTGVPVTYLIFLEKELVDLHTFVAKMVELDSSENWTKDPTSGQYRSEPVKTSTTKKLQRPIVLYDATEHHPAQTQLVPEDVVVGHWTTTKYSGAIPATKKRALKVKITKLIEAVKIAREQANMTSAERQAVGAKVLDYVFGGDP